MYGPALASAGVATDLITPSGVTSPNYTISFAAGTLTVSKASLTITADNKSRSDERRVGKVTRTLSSPVHGEKSRYLTAMRHSSLRLQGRARASLCKGD